MKRMALTILAFCCGLATYAQGKQQRVMLQQIAALKVYIDYAKKGYEVARKGLKVIGDFKDGEFNLHGDYFTSLGLVSPAVRNYIRVSQAVCLQLRILDEQSTLHALMQSSAFLSQQERSYIGRVMERLEADCEGYMEELLTLTTDGNLELTDKQRLSRIDTVHAAMQDNAAFARHFSSEVSLLLQARARDNRDVEWQRMEQNLN